jgi:hypothetical protein
MKQRTLTTLYAYWNELRGRRIAPRRLEIEPSRIAGILAETFMLEPAGPGTYRFRLAGTKLCETFGTELRGSNFLEGWDAKDRVEIDHLLAAGCGQGAAVFLHAEACQGTERRFELDAVLLPLVHGGNAIGRIIGAITASSQPHQASKETPITLRLLRHEVVWPDGRPHSLVTRSGGRAPFLPVWTDASIAPTRKDDRPRFRVLDGGRRYDKA